MVLLRERWTAAHNDLLQTLLEIRPALSWLDIAGHFADLIGHLSRSWQCKQIRNMAARVLVPAKPPSRAILLSDAERALLQRLCTDERPPKWHDLAKQFRCGIDKLRDEATRLGINKRRGWRQTYERYPDRNRRLCDLVRSGMSRGAAAKLCGMTRNAAIGACWRHGLVCVSKPKAEKPTISDLRAPHPPQAAAPPASIWRPINGRAPVPMLDAVAYQCRWPLWDKPSDPRVVCGCAVSHAAWTTHRIHYCEAHFLIATREPDDRAPFIPNAQRFGHSR